MRYEILVKNKYGKVVERHLFDKYKEAMARMDVIEDRYYGKMQVELKDNNAFAVEKRNRYAYG